MKSRLTPWKTLRSTNVLDNPWYHVRKDSVQLPNGTIIEDYYVSMLKSVAVIFALTEDNNVIFVRQFRYPVQQTLIELPAGTYTNEQAAETVARQELLEETGYTAPIIQSLGMITEYPTKDSHHVSLFLATNARLVQKQQLENTEDIEVILIPLEKLTTYINKGEIMVSGTIACIMKALIHLNIIK